MSPPRGFAVAVPLFPPLQLTSVFVAVADKTTAGSVIVTSSVAVQLLASVTVTV